MTTLLDFGANRKYFHRPLLSNRTLFLTAVLCLTPSLVPHTVSYGAASPELHALCPGWNVQGDLNPSLTDLEKRLICGDSEVQDAWRKIPFNQAKFNMNNFLQERGYFRPNYKLPPPAEPEPNPSTAHSKQPLGAIQVVLGEKTLVKDLILRGPLPQDTLETLVPLSHKRKVVGEVLTPSLLNTLERWTSDELKRAGYACPDVKTAADPDTGVIELSVDPGTIRRFGEVSQESIPGSAPQLLRRYDSFEEGQIYNDQLLAISENRSTSIKIVESNHFSTHCSSDTPKGAPDAKAGRNSPHGQVSLPQSLNGDQPGGFALEQLVVPGAAHILTTGVGINTEGLILGRISWADTRLGFHGSLLSVTASASALTQQLTSQMKWYLLPDFKRFYFNPFVQLSHRNLNPYEDVSIRGQLGIATTQEIRQNPGGFGGTYFLGPTLDIYSLLRGTGNPNTRLLSLEGRADWKSYDYEYYSSDPREGYQVGIILDFSSQALLSTFDAQRVSATWEALWNLGLFDPPLWILGARGGFAALVAGGSQGTDGLPSDLLRFLGGSTDIRGFGYQELPLRPSGMRGGLTSLFLGLEMRLSHTLPYKIDPFVFWDVGATGLSAFSFDLPIYWSPGFGLRWASPIGAIRTTLAPGYSNADFQHWQAYFSLGEEF